MSHVFTLFIYMGGGPGSWAGPAWVWLGGPGSWAGPAYTINKLDSDKDVNIIRPRDLTVIRMLI